MTGELHPLLGLRLRASSFSRKGSEWLLVVDLPDGSPGMISAAATDIFGDQPARVSPRTVLTVEGVRELRVVAAAIGVPKRRRAPKRANRLAFLNHVPTKSRR